MQTLVEKRATAEEFARRLLASDVGDGIVKIILFGSVARGDAREESDVDVLVLTIGRASEVQAVCSDISYDMMLEGAPRVEAWTLPCDQAQDPPALFIAYALEEGREVFSLPSGEQIRREIRARLAEAREALAEAQRCALRSDRRAAIVTGYSAAEHAARALLLDRTGRAPRDHGAVVSEFGRVLVTREGIAPGRLGHELNFSLAPRARALYGWTRPVTEEEAARVVQLARELVDLADSEIPSVQDGRESDSDE